MTFPTPPSQTLPRIAAAALAVALAALPATAQETGGTDADDAAPETMAMDALTAETVIATVGDYELTLGELISVRQKLPQQYQNLPAPVLLEGLMEQLVNQTILAEQARETGLDDRTDVALDLINQQNSSLADAYIRAEIEKRITPDALRAAYEARYVEAGPERQVRASHILVESREMAAELRAEIEGGADFADLAAEHGTDGTAQRGGDLGWFSEGDMVPEFAAAAFAMEPGSVSDPVETPFGWHLIKLVDTREKPVPEFAEVQQELLESLASEAQAEVVQDARATTEVTMPEKAHPPEAILADGLIKPGSEEPAE